MSHKFPEEGQVFIATEGALYRKYFNDAAVAKANQGGRNESQKALFPKEQGPLLYIQYQGDPAIDPRWNAYMRASAPEHCGHYVSLQAAEAMGYTDGTFAAPAGIPETMVFYATEGPLKDSYFIPPTGEYFKEQCREHLGPPMFGGQKVRLPMGYLASAWMAYSIPFEGSPEGPAKFRGGWIPLTRAIELRLRDGTTNQK